LGPLGEPPSMIPASVLAARSRSRAAITAKSSAPDISDSAPAASDDQVDEDRVKTVPVTAQPTHSAVSAARSWLSNHLDAELPAMASLADIDDPPASRADFSHPPAVAESSLHLAANGGGFDLTKSLIEEGAALDVRDDLGRTPLHLAVRYNHCDEAWALISAGASLDARDGQGRQALHHAAEKGHTSILEELLVAGARVDSRGFREWTPLHFAAYCGKVAMVAELLSAGASPNLRDCDGNTPLQLAHEQGHSGTAAVLKLAAAAMTPAAAETPQRPTRQKLKRAMSRLTTSPRLPSAAGAPFRAKPTPPSPAVATSAMGRRTSPSTAAIDPLASRNRAISRIADVKLGC